MSTDSPPKHFDAVVIGSGQSGTPLATALAQSGCKTALIERSHIGGTCINEGCTPTKTMVASGRVSYLARRAAEYGVWNVPAKELERGHVVFHGKEEGGWENVNVAVEMAKVRQRKRDIVENFRGGSEGRLGKVEGLEVIMGEARFEDAKTLSVKMGGTSEEEATVQAEQIFINVGERPARPELPGLEALPAERVVDSTSILELGEVPHHLIVLGGGYIGLEFGQLFKRLGSKVTIIQRAKQLVPREDLEVADALKKILEEDGIRVILNTSVANIKPDDCGNVAHKVIVFYQDERGRSVSVNGSHLLLAAGRTPNTDTLNLPAAGVEVDKRGHIKVNPQLETNVDHIYALGDVHGGPAFTHMSYDDFRIIKTNLLSPSPPATPASTTDRQVPYVMYTDPQLGHVGLHEHEARAKYGDAAIKTATMPMAYVARALETDESRGLMKAVVHAETGQILGFTCLGLEGGEIMSIVQMAMKGKLRWEVLRDMTFAHPSLAESLNNVWGYLK